MIVDLFNGWKRSYKSSISVPYAQTVLRSFRLKSPHKKLQLFKEGHELLFLSVYINDLFSVGIVNIRRDTNPPRFVVIIIVNSKIKPSANIHCTYCVWQTAKCSAWIVSLNSHYNLQLLLLIPLLCRWGNWQEVWRPAKGPQRPAQGSQLESDGARLLS